MSYHYNGSVEYDFDYITGIETQYDVEGSLLQTIDHKKNKYYNKEGQEMSFEESCQIDGLYILSN